MKLETVTANAHRLLADTEYAGWCDLETACRLLRPVIVVAPSDLSGALRDARCGSDYDGFPVYRIDGTHRAAAREAIQASYKVSDALPREYRASAWTLIQTQLRLRWLRGDFSVPRAGTMRAWCIGARAVNPDTWETIADAPALADARVAA